LNEQLYQALLDHADKDAAWALLDDTKHDVLAARVEAALLSGVGGKTQASAERWVRIHDPAWKDYHKAKHEARLAKAYAWAWVSRLRSLEREVNSAEADNRAEMKFRA
jgi:hypothetical protein